MPAGARIPTHWDAAGHPNGFGSPASFFLQPALGLAVVLLLAALPYIEPRRGRALMASPIYPVVLIGLTLFFLVIEVLSVSAAVGRSGLVPRLVPPAIGALFVLIGVFLPSVKSNFFIGIRTPWTLSSETAWRKTHQLGAWTFAAAGVLVALSTALPAVAMGPVLLGAVGVGGGIPAVYSYLAWRSAPDRASFASSP